MRYNFSVIKISYKIKIQVAPPNVIGKIITKFIENIKTIFNEKDSYKDTALLSFTIF